MKNIAVIIIFCVVLVLGSTYAASKTDFENIYKGLTSEDDEILGYLNRNSNAVDLTNAGQETLLMYAVQNKNLKVIDYLLNIGADVNLHNKDGISALMIAAVIGDEAVLKAVLSAKALRIDQQDNTGRTALMLAAVKDKQNILKLLMDTGGASLNIRDANAENAVAYAIRGKQYDNMVLLVDKGASLQESKIKSGYGLLYHAFWSQDQKIIKYLQNKGKVLDRPEELESLYYAVVYHKDYKSLVLLDQVKLEAYLNNYPYSYMLLQMGVRTEDREIIKYLCSKTQSGKLCYITEDGDTLLLYALRNTGLVNVSFLRGQIFGRDDSKLLFPIAKKYYDKNIAEVNSMLANVLDLNFIYGAKNPQAADYAMLLVLACLNNDHKLVNVLLVKDKSKTIWQNKILYESAVYAAVLGNSTETAKLILSPKK